MVVQNTGHVIQTETRDQLTALYWWEFCCIYMNFCIDLTHFYINFSRQEHQI